MAEKRWIDGDGRTWSKRRRSRKGENLVYYLEIPKLGAWGSAYGSSDVLCLRDIYI
jgi:hypothetical protein